MQPRFEHIEPSSAAAAVAVKAPGTIAIARSLSHQACERLPLGSYMVGGIDEYAWALLRCAFTALFCSTGCAGKVNGEQSSQATCGNDCTPAAVAALCQATCDKLTQAGCSTSSTCPMDC